MITVDTDPFFKLLFLIFSTYLQTVLGGLALLGASLVAQTVKRLLAMWETWVQSLGRERPPGEGNGNPLQFSCLGNPMNGGTQVRW